MTTALVVYESLFGDNRAIAYAVADGLAQHLAVEAMPVGRAPSTLGDEMALLVVGGPNHAFGMPKPATREGAVRDSGASPAPEDTGLREWLTALTTTCPGIPAAAWDTRMDHPRLLVKADHAAHSEEKLLRLRGFDLVVPAEHFVVTSTSGPLAAGEEDRARAWGARLGELAAARVVIGR